MKPETRYQSGLSAEQAVARHYADAGFEIRAERYRTPRGEIDLIAHRGDEVIFVEVKKSSTHDQAAQRLSETQMARIFGAAEIYLGTQPLGSETPSRFDVALVDAQGMIHILENAFGA